MNRRTAVQLLLSGGLTALTACFGSYGRTVRRNSSRLMQLQIGDSRSRVLGILGRPHRNERYMVEGKEYEVFFYRTSHSADGLETDDEFTPVVLIDGVLQGWSRNYYETRIRLILERAG